MPRIAKHQWKTTSGDTLAGIASRIYGDKRLYKMLAIRNGVDNPDLIYPGQIIQLPTKLGSYNRKDKAASNRTRTSNGASGSGRHSAGGKKSIKKSNNGTAPPSRYYARVAKNLDDVDLYYRLLLARGAYAMKKTKNSGWARTVSFPTLGHVRVFLIYAEQEAFDRGMYRLYNPSDGIFPLPGTEPRTSNGGQLTKKEAQEWFDQAERSRK